MCKYKRTIEKVINDLGFDLKDYSHSKGHYKFFVEYADQGPYKLVFPGSPNNGCAENPVYIKKSIKQNANIPDVIKERIFNKKQKEPKMVRKKLKLSKKPVVAVKPERVLTPEQNIQLGYARLQAYRNSLRKDLTNMQSVVQ